MSRYFTCLRFLQVWLTALGECTYGACLITGLLARIIPCTQMWFSSEIHNQKWL